ncbi:MAG: XisI protein [Caldilineaceae bacterium]
MDRLEKYRNAIETVINEYANIEPAYGDISMEAVTDREHDHYEVMMMGWDNHERVHSSIIHIDILNNKIWIQHDATDTGVAYELVELGVPKEDIVLAFHPPYKRPYTEFAVN